MNLEAVTKGQNVKLNQDVKTMTAEHKAGDTYKVLGFQGSLVRLSRTTDRVKLFTLADYLDLVS